MKEKGIIQGNEASRVVFQRESSWLKCKPRSLETRDKGSAPDPCGSEQIQGEPELPSRTHLGIFPIFQSLLALPSAGFQHLEVVVDSQGSCLHSSWELERSRDHFQRIRESPNIPNFGGHSRVIPGWGPGVWELVSG